jgi:3-methyladenine DNA glycosylase Mpg
MLHLILSGIRRAGVVLFLRVRGIALLLNFIAGVEEAPNALLM